VSAAVKVHGQVSPGFEPVAEAFATNFAEHGEIGAACTLYLDAQPVVDIWGGLAEVEPARPWAQDTIVIAFSCTKGATAVCANKLIQEGRLDPDAPVARYWPEFAANGKADIPVRWTLSHRAGLAGVEGDFTLDDVAAWDPIVAGIPAHHRSESREVLRDRGCRAARPRLLHRRAGSTRAAHRPALPRGA
jgi:CubicO group peptidase (beta-lactamase class C family)